MYGAKDIEIYTYRISMHKHAPRFNTIISDKAHRRIASVGASLFLELFKIYRVDHLAKQNIAISRG